MTGEDVDFRMNRNIRTPSGLKPPVSGHCPDIFRAEFRTLWARFIPPLIHQPIRGVEPARGAGLAGAEVEDRLALAESMALCAVASWLKPRTVRRTAYRRETR